MIVYSVQTVNSEHFHQPGHCSQYAPNYCRLLLYADHTAAEFRTGSGIRLGQLGDNLVDPLGEALQSQDIAVITSDAPILCRLG